MRLLIQLSTPRDVSLLRAFRVVFCFNYFKGLNMLIVGAQVFPVDLRVAPATKSLFDLHAFERVSVPGISVLLTMKRFPVRLAMVLSPE